MMIRKKILDDVGMIPELYFLYYEELDFCVRVRNSGYKIWYVGTSTVYHKESMTVGKINALKTYYMTRNRILFLRRNVKGTQLLLSILFFIFFTIPKNSAVHIARRRFDLLRALYSGAWWHVGNGNVS